MKPTFQEETKIMVEDCLKKKRHLTPWELDFILNIQTNYLATITAKQYRKLVDIWDRVGELP